MSTAKTIHQERLVPTLAVVTFAKIMLNGARRFPYLILTPMAAALGVPRSTVEAALSAQWAVGIFSPLVGSAIDRVGRKRMMLIGMGGLAVFMAVAAVGQVAGIVLLGLVASGIAKIIFDPAMEAYIGDHTPYERRGTAIGITELAWSASLFIFGPLAVYLIVQASLGAIFAVLAAGSAFSVILLWRIVPADHPTEHHEQPKTAIRDVLRLLASPSVLALLVVGAFISIAAESISIIYEAWLRQSFGITTLVLGTVAWVFSAAEVTGEGVVIGIADRFGKRSLALVAIVATGIVYLMLPLLGTSDVTAVALLFLMYLFFEITVVVLIPLATEALPEARGVMLTAYLAAVSVGRAFGTLLGGWMFRTAGIGLNGVVAMTLSLVSAALIWRYVVERR